VIAGEIAVEHHIAQAALPARGNGRQAGERRLPPAIGFDDTHAARPLGDEETPFRQKRYGPGVLQVPGHHLRSHVLGHGHATRGQHRYRKIATGTARFLVIISFHFRTSCQPGGTWHRFCM